MGGRGWIILVCVALGGVALGDGASEAEVPAIFIFGDSTVDVGTNNFLKHSLAKANKPYYGIDYASSRPTGRFSNGYNIADLIVRHLGGYKRSPPPFLYLLNHMSGFKKAILHGVNFASGGSGIFDETGNITFKEVIPLRQQIEQFASVCGNLTEGSDDQTEAGDLLSKSLYIISVGSNDFFDYQQNASVPHETFMANLIDSYANHLEKLYKLGARKFGILSVPPIGCLPIERALNVSGGCMDEMNTLARAFYKSTRSLLQQFSSQFIGAKYSLGNIYLLTMSVIQGPLADGFKDIKTPCCGDETTTCKPGAKLCSNRDTYLFWDRYHPTQAASDIAAQILVNSEAADQFVTPVNFNQLAKS